MRRPIGRSIGRSIGDPWDDPLGIYWAIHGGPIGPIGRTTGDPLDDPSEIHWSLHGGSIWNPLAIHWGSIGRSIGDPLGDPWGIHWTIHGGSMGDPLGLEKGYWRTTEKCPTGRTFRSPVGDPFPGSSSGPPAPFARRMGLRGPSLRPGKWASSRARELSQNRPHSELPR